MRRARSSKSFTKVFIDLCKSSDTIRWMEIWQLLRHLHHWELHQDCECSLWWFWQLCELQESLHHPTFHVLVSFFSLFRHRSFSLAFKTLNWRSLFYFSNFISHDHRKRNCYWSSQLWFPKYSIKNFVFSPPLLTF